MPTTAPHSRFGAIALFLATSGYVQAASQLEPIYRAIAKDPQSAEALNVDLFKADPAEEAPVITRAIESGNQAVMNAAVRNAITILGIHKSDEENHNLRKLKPSLQEVIKDFQTLRSVVAAHFEDTEPDVPGELSKDDFSNTHWKTQVVQFVDLSGDSPTPGMVAWMLRVIQWPKGRAQEYVARIERDSIISNLEATHSAFLRTMTEHFRSVALDVAPVLARLGPIPDPVAGALMNQIDEANESLVAVEIIRGMAENKALNPEIADRLVLKALDDNASIEVRVAAIYAVARLKPVNISKLIELKGSADEKIARAMTDIGLQ